MVTETYTHNVNRSFHIQDIVDMAMYRLRIETLIDNSSTYYSIIRNQTYTLTTKKTKRKKKLSKW